MSRIGLLPIPVPEDTQVNIEGNKVTVKGSKGEIYRCFHPDISIKLEEGNIIVSRGRDDKMHRSLHGLTRSLLANMVEGVSKGFEKVLEIKGVGYRVQGKGDKLSFQIGYSHPVEYQIPSNVSISIEGTNRIYIKGIDKQVVGKVAAEIRAIRPADCYKGKGIRYGGEQIRLKPGKAGKAVAGG
jgi:large subunit ribosomal protein L6